jgi:hypothetical protein
MMMRIGLVTLAAALLFAGVLLVSRHGSPPSDDLYTAGDDLRKSGGDLFHIQNGERK